MTNFTFVPHKGARPERSELVKSHVMRESQRRRREDKGRRGRPGALKTRLFCSDADLYKNTRLVENCVHHRLQ